jgi:4-alpha-glucanotransferase
MNVPGRADGNWLFRTTEDTINQIDADYYKHINRLFKRK